MPWSKAAVRLLAFFGLALFLVVLSPFLLFSSLLFIFRHRARGGRLRSLYVAWVYRSALLYELHSMMCTFPVWDDSFENVGNLRGLVLYLACGTGNGAAIMERNGARLVCADLNARFLRWGLERKKVRRPVVADAYALPFRAGCFDHIVIAVSLHHLLDLPALMAECSRTLHPNGSIVLYDPVSVRPRTCRISNMFHDGPIWLFDRDSLRASVVAEAASARLELIDVTFFRPVSVQNFNPVYPMIEMRVALSRRER